MSLRTGAKVNSWLKEQKEWGNKQQVHSGIAKINQRQQRPADLNMADFPSKNELFVKLWVYEYK